MTFWLFTLIKTGFLIKVTHRNGTKRKRGNFLLLIPHFEAFALPSLVERATQIAHADMNIFSPHEQLHLIII